MDTRRDFIKKIGISGASLTISNTSNQNLSHRRQIKFGICTDVHKDIMHDANERLQSFIDEASLSNLDFIIQLGDFCCPNTQNLSFLAIWNSYIGDKYHVLGNHDTDGGFSKAQVIKYWNSLGSYYSFDCQGYHFVVLDGNEKNPTSSCPGGYDRYIGEEQLKWLENDLQVTSLPTIIFCHQGLDNDVSGITNATRCRFLLEECNRKSGFQKVKVVFSGHHHLDYHNQINAIHYVQINSMSYQWLGEAYQTERYDEHIQKSHPWIKYTVPYKDPIWATVEIFDNRTMRIKGKNTVFVGLSPKQLYVNPSTWVYPITPTISDRSISLR
ncbi:metallophosphoesterase family protein [Flectobacillus roseus]|uniref:metallophosphoesterase family protein n=1 Tax=Flectobacillus roseus TaxID=502259 RepID=UPI00362EA397